MVKIIFSDVNGNERLISDAEVGMSMMEVAKANGVAGIAGDCGGACSCATCHVFVDPDWWEKIGEPDDIEFAILDMVADVSQPTSRLSCQIKLTEELNGLRVTVAPGGGF